MKELTAILEAWFGQTGQPAALATLVQASGSTYRRPGARMLILPDGQSVGSISGGCLERDVIEKAAPVMAQGQTTLLTYDTTSEEDLVFGAGLGCKGTVHILLEPVSPGMPAADLLDFVSQLFRQRRSGLVATVFQTKGLVPIEVGRRLMLSLDGPASGQIREGAIHAKILGALREIQTSGRSKCVELEMPSGRVDAFLEIIHAPVPLLIFGAGYDALPLVRLAREIGFHVTVADVRPAYATPERFPEANAVVVIPPDEISRLGLTERAAAVIMSHNYLTDRAFLKALLEVPLRYLGLMGPRARAKKMVEELRQEGFTASEASVLSRIHNPVGLDIGAETPEQIALAILAEIQAEFSGQPGGRLRDKKTPIHSPPHGRR